MRNYRVWFPLPQARPIKTFPERLTRKLIWINNNSFKKLCVRIGLLGATIVGQSSNGNTILKLNKDYALGPKGTLIELPQDQAIFESVKNRGNWELEESRFLARNLNQLTSIPVSRIALLDIGANSGLVALQTINLSNVNCEVFLFEPLPRHVRAIEENLRSLPGTHINEFALSDNNGYSMIHTDFSNNGNSSFFETVVPRSGIVSTKVRLVDTQEYCDNFLNNFDKFIIKSDTQGMDALILSRLPRRIWEKCVAAVIEVWALPQVNKKDVESLLSMLEDFEYLDWSPTFERKLSLHEIQEFWLGNSDNQKNLFVRK